MALQKNAGSESLPDSPALSLKTIFLRFKWRISFTFSLVFIETLLDLLYPLFIGWAINDLLAGKYDGVYLLVTLGVASILIGSARRFYDTRIYAGIYKTITPEMVSREKLRGQSTSTIAARSQLLTEFVEFLENAMPEVIGSMVGLVGVLMIISALNINVFAACLLLLGLILLIYMLTGSLNYRLNAGYNGELENQVGMIEQQNMKSLKAHYHKLMSWNIKLSDLETGNYFLIWLGVVALFAYSPVAAIGQGELNYGLIFSLMMYVFEFIEKAATLPLYLQQIIRLKEISTRIA